MEETIDNKKAPLEDLMVAMDVVDTLRHREKLVDRELDADARRERLIEKLREIYQAQGIEVTDQVLADGVKALEEDRFKYDPPEKNFSSHLANIYVKRDKWLKPFLVILALLISLWSYNYFVNVRPEIAAQNAIPDQLSQTYDEVIQITNDQNILSQAHSINGQGKSAIKNENYAEARTAQEELELMLIQLKSTYKLRVVQEQGERSGVYRIPDANSSAKNYYLIIEAIDSRGNVLSLPITSEEDGKIKVVSKWGIRVDESVYKSVGADKKDDGIIQNRAVGKKERGQIYPEYSIPTNGSAITDW
ncbi:MAG: DUF6384 family protein [Gammaproteobacteria bacterium]